MRSSRRRPETFVKDPDAAFGAGSVEQKNVVAFSIRLPLSSFDDSVDLSSFQSFRDISLHRVFEASPDQLKVLLAASHFFQLVRRVFAVQVGNTFEAVKVLEKV